MAPFNTPFKVCIPAVQHNLKVIYVVPCNGEYAILKEFAVLRKRQMSRPWTFRAWTSFRPLRALAAPSVLAKTKAEIKEAFANALKADGPTLIAIPIAHQDRHWSRL